MIGNIALFFLPEFVKIHNGKIENHINFLSPIERDFIRSYFHDRMEEHKQMREKGEPDDLITKVIINDDIGTMKDILSHKNDFATFGKKEIPFSATRYINYAAAYGSINCFKYFLLNHSQVDSFTLQYAVYGGNVEIIRIVDQIYNESGIKNSILFHE